MKRILTALTLSAVLASPAWSSDAGLILERGTILYSNESLKPVGANLYTVNFVGVAYKQKVYVCEIVTELAEVRCILMEDKGIVQKQD